MRRSRPSSQTAPAARANRHAASAHISGVPAWDEDRFFEELEARKDPLVLLLDEVTDPHNLGACLRTANAAGVLAVLTPKHHSASVTDTVVRISCAAALHTPVVAVSNLARAMDRLKQAGLWLVGTDDRAERLIHEVDLKGPIGLVMGAEGSGMRRLTRESCDFLVRIPMLGQVPCLNVSVATGVCLFEAVRQRAGANAGN